MAAQRIRVLEEEYRQLSQTNQLLHEAITQVRATLGLSVNLLLSLTLDFLQLLIILTFLQPMPEQLTRTPLTWIRTPANSEQSAAPYLTPTETPAPSLMDSSDATNTTKVSMDDPTSKVLPAALQKHKIKEEDWGDYGMFITYGPPGNGILPRS